MTRSLRVGISQRVDQWADRNERRDALDQRLCQWVLTSGHVPVPIPNSIGLLQSTEIFESGRDWLSALNPSAVILSGGNDIGEVPERDATEGLLLNHAKENSLPVLGICRGMQMMAFWAGGELAPLSGHVRTRHQLRLESDCEDWPHEVNSYHDHSLVDCPPGFSVAARAEDGSIEAICHQNLPWEGWMWHPEREPEINDIEIKRFQALLQVGIS